MRIVPDSSITLYKDVDIDHGEQLIFKSKNNQSAYFASKVHPNGSYVNCTVVRKTGTIKVEKSMSIVSQCNYLSFINPSFDNKTVYARIVDYDYVNNECTEITYAIDYWQTWMFDVSFEDMYIDREHLSQADWDKAELNPYDPTIFEFRTGESLSVSKDMEKLNYSIGSNNTDDGYRITRALTEKVSVDNTMGVLIKLNNIDLEALDSGFTGAVADTPSCIFATYLSSILNMNNGVNSKIGFFSITKPMYDYLSAKHTANPSVYPLIAGEYVLGSGWVQRDSTPIYPYKSSKYNPGCCLIYDPCGADKDLNNGVMGTFLNLMTKWGNVDKIIDMSIIPNNIMMFAGIPNAYAGGTPYEPAQTTPDINVVNKKLYRFPYSYLRVMAPNGDVKEYKYEHFKNITDGNGYAGLAAMLDLTDRPTLIIVPRGYKYSGMSQSYGLDGNITEAIFFDQFPTMPYTIDAFTAQVAAVANSTIGNRTVDNAADMAAMDVATDRTSQNIATLQVGLNAASTAVGGAGRASISPTYNDPSIGPESGINGIKGSGLAGAGLSIGQGVAMAASMRSAGAQMEMDRKKFEAASERWMGASDALGGADGNVIATQLRLTKPAYACDKYVPSNGIGTSNFNIASFCDVVFLRVGLADEVLSVYDNWFSHYGYTSGRCGIPRVINYSRGISTDADVPHWQTLNGKPTTYVKTMDCKVLYSMVPVASTIKSMFDSGVRMIKGDLT